jgi:hypothetical protein
LYRERASREDILSHPDIPSWVSEAYRILSSFSTEGENEDLTAKTRQHTDAVRRRQRGCSARSSLPRNWQPKAPARPRSSFARICSVPWMIRNGPAVSCRHAMVEAGELRAALAAAQVEAGELRAESRRLDADLRQTADDLRQRAEELAALRARHDSVLAALNAVYASRSWRMTALPRKVATVAGTVWTAARLVRTGDALGRASLPQRAVPPPQAPLRCRPWRANSNSAMSNLRQYS